MKEIFLLVEKSNKRKNKLYFFHWRKETKHDFLKAFVNGLLLQVVLWIKQVKKNLFAFYIYPFALFSVH